MFLQRDAPGFLVQITHVWMVVSFGVGEPFVHSFELTNHDEVQILGQVLFHIVGGQEPLEVFNLIRGQRHGFEYGRSRPEQFLNTGLGG